MIKKILNVKTILFILLGTAIGLILFVLGEADDAPGLSAIGLLLAFLLIMRGIYYAHILRRGYHIPIIVMVFGILFIIFPIMLLLDGEILKLSAVFSMMMAAGIFMIILSIISIIKNH